MATKMEQLDFQTVINKLPSYDDEDLYKATCDALRRILVKNSNLRPSCEMAAHLHNLKMTQVIEEVRQVLPANYFKDRALANTVKRNNRLTTMKKARYS